MNRIYQQFIICVFCLLGLTGLNVYAAVSAPAKTISVETGSETELTAAIGDKNEPVIGQSFLLDGTYNAGRSSVQMGEMTSRGFKLRTGWDGSRAVFTVTRNYTLKRFVGIGISNYAMAEGAQGDVNVRVTKVEVDGVEVPFSGGEFYARETGITSTLTIDNINAHESIAIYFDNSNSAGKQLLFCYAIDWEHTTNVELSSLQQVPFCTWNGWGADAQATGTASYEWHVGEPADVAYGDPAVINYADLSGYLKLEVTVAEGTPRFLLNRTMEEGQWSEDESQSYLIDNTQGGWSAKYFTQEGNTYTVNLELLARQKGFAHLHAIKGANWAPVTLTEMRLYKEKEATDLSSFIVNPNFDNASPDGWQGDTPNMVGAGNHGAANVAEHWNHMFNTWQELVGLPDGTYLLEAKTAFRGSWEDYERGRKPAARLYATVGDKTFETPFNNMWSCLNTDPMQGNTYFGTWAEEQSIDMDGTTYYIPNDPSAFRLYAERGYYDTQLFFEVSGGTARIGVKNEAMCEDGCDNWSVFDSFSLTYLGTEPKGWVEQLTNGNAEGTDLTCFIGRDGGDSDQPARIVSGVGYNDSRAFTVHSIANPQNDWDSQFFVYTPNHLWLPNAKYRFSFKVRADKPAHISAQSQYTPGDYIYWEMAAGGYDVTTEWQEFYYEGAVTAEQVGDKDGMHCIAFNLNELRGEENNFFFDDISWESFEGEETDIANFASFKALGNGVEGKLRLKNAVVSFAKGRDVFLEDASGALEFYDTGLPFETGQLVNGTVIGKLSIYNDLPEFVKTDNTNADNLTFAEGTVVAKDMTVADALKEENISKLAKISNVEIAEDGGKYYVVDGDAKLQIYDKFKVIPAGYTYPEKANVTGIICIYKGTMQIMPISEESIEKIADLPTADIADGRYYLKNVATGLFWGAANDWGTQASLVKHPEYVTLHKQPNGTYTLESQVSNGGEQYYFGGDYMDSDAVGLTIAPASDGYYTIALGNDHFGYDGENTVMGKWIDPTSENACWQIIGENEMRQSLNDATADSPADATFLILDPNFSRNHRNQSAWIGDGFSVGGDNSNFNAEKWGGNSQTFDVSQTVDAPNGLYMISWNGFYRYNNTTENTNEIAIAAHADGTEKINSFIYINGNDYSLTSIADEAASAALEGKLPFSQGEASAAFGQDLYAQTATVIVADGKLTIGIKKTEHPGCDWTVWDNFELYYLGNDVPQDDHQFKVFTENTVLLTTVDNISQEKEQLNWIEGGTYQAMKNGTINPLNGQEGTAIVTEGVLLKKGNAEKALQTYVTGVESVWAYGCAAGSTSRDLVVTVYDQMGNVVASERGTSSNYKSVKVEVKGLNPAKKYKVDYTGCNIGSDAGADVVLHGIKFVKKYYVDKTFVSNQIKYHVIAYNQVEVVGYEAPPASLSIPVSVSDENITYSVVAIAEKAFQGCGFLERVSIPSTVTQIGRQAFRDCVNLKSFSVTSTNPYYFVQSGVLFSKDNDQITLIRYPQAKSSGYYDIPDKVEVLDESAFQGCTNLEYVSIPESVRYFAATPFEGCTSLNTVVSLRREPVESDKSVFPDAVYAKATLYVPDGCVVDYRSLSPWKWFEEIKKIPSTITLTAKSYDITYGDALPTPFEYTVTEGPLYGVANTSCSVTSTSKAGKYDIVISNKTLHSPSELKFVNGTLTINKAPLTISVGDYTKKQGDPLPEFTVQYSGFVKNETYAVLTKKPTVKCNATASSAPGTYPITVSGAETPNYDISYVNGTLTVVSADAIIVRAKSYTINYGDDVPTFEYTVEGGQLDGRPAITCSAGSRPDVGVYDIIISKGSVKNYNVTFEKGTLTVNKATLTVSVGNYTKYEDEENPEFVLSYNGFKFYQDASVLTKAPTAYCEARLWSPAGTYPITISGGEARNYDFNYKEGTLTVKSVYSLTISTVGKGFVSYNSEEITNYSRFNVREGADVMLTFVADEGYQLEKLTSNGEDITSQVKDKVYILYGMKEELNIVATFGERIGAFIENGISYQILSAPDKTVVVDKNPLYKGNLVIPSAVTHNGVTWSVQGIAANAFDNCSSLVSIELPKSLVSKEVGLSLFTGCSSLAAIISNANFQLTTAMLGSIENPNLLFYVTNSVFAPADINNVVVGDKAESIVLQDGNGVNNSFYCPRGFTAASITYTHHYSMTSAIGGIQGWETLALPFRVDRVVHETQGVIVPFIHYNPYDASYSRPFWLYTYGANGFVRASSIEANMPYLICMPNNEEYDEEYRLAGHVTFRGNNVWVDATANAKTLTRGSKSFVPAFAAQNKSDEVYTLNAVNDLHDETGGYAPGSKFISGLRAVCPFEAYLTHSASASRVMEIDFAEGSGIDELLADCEWLQSAGLRVYNLSGLLVIQAGSKQELLQTLKRLPKGIYIIGGKKYQIK